jgi:hypothetical protein
MSPTTEIIAADAPSKPSALVLTTEVSASGFSVMMN